MQFTDQSTGAPTGLALEFWRHTPAAPSRTRRTPTPPPAPTPVTLTATNANGTQHERGHGHHLQRPRAGGGRLRGPGRHRQLLQLRPHAGAAGHD
ncbi:MAG: hypothetical protein WKG07_05290 [Hymenobacter sp.]